MVEVSHLVGRGHHPLTCVPSSRLNHMTAGMNMNQCMKPDPNKEIEEAMKRVREAQSLISAAIEPGSK